MYTCIYYRIYLFSHVYINQLEGALEVPWHMPRAHGDSLRFNLGPQAVHNGPQTNHNRIRLQGVQIHAYLDDLVVIAHSPGETLRALTLTIKSLTRAGFVINVK